MIKQQPITEVDVEMEEQSGVANSDAIDDALVGYLKECWGKAKFAKNHMTERLLKSERQRRGEYDPDRAMEIAQTGGSDIYMMISDIKCRAAASWIKDVMMTQQERPFELHPSEEPQMPPEIKAMIVDFVRVEADDFIKQGALIHPEAFRARMEEIHETINLRVREEAQDSARRMEGVIEDQLLAGGWEKSLEEFIDDFVTYPTAVIKGPTIRRKKRLAWGPEFAPVVVNDFVRDIQRVSPYDIYPSPNSQGPDDGYLIERHRLRRGALEALIGVPGYSTTNIQAAIDQYGQTGLRYLENGDQARDNLQGKPNSRLYNDNTIEALEFWGPIQGSMLIEWGMSKKDIDPYKDYEVNAWLVGSYCIKAVVNPDPLGRRPYEIASWSKIPGAFWGVGLPEIVRDVQIMCNAAARSLANNMGIASGPQVEVAVDRLADGEDLTAMYPWKIWQTTTDKTGGGQPGVRFFMPDMKAGELMNIYQTFSKQADEVTGIPNYVYGSSAVAGAGRTASGLSMLMDNAAKGIKQAVGAIDKVVQGVVYKLYVHNMMYNPDPYLKGDFRIVAKGALGLIAKEQLQIRRNEFLQATSNPMDMQIVGPEGRSYLLRELARGLQMDTDKLVPPPEMQKYKAEQAMRQQQEQAMMEQALMAEAGMQQGQPQLQAPQTLDPAGNPAGGVDANLMQ
jgi:hypothetical protein